MVLVAHSAEEYTYNYEGRTYITANGTITNKKYLYRIFNYHIKIMKIGRFKVCETSETEERPQTSLYKTGAIVQTNKDNLSFSKRTGIISVGCASSSLLFNQRKS